MQTHIKEHSCRVYDFVKFRNVYKSAEYWYWMMRPTVVEMAGKFGISTSRAERWINSYITRRNNDEQ